MSKYTQTVYFIKVHNQLNLSLHQASPYNDNYSVFDNKWYHMCYLSVVTSMLMMPASQLCITL